MNDALIILGWILGAAVVAACATYLGRLFLIWLFNRISDHIEHHISTALAKPLYPETLTHKQLDDEYRQLITNQEDHNGQ